MGGPSRAHLPQAASLAILLMVPPNKDGGTVQMKAGLQMHQTLYKIRKIFSLLTGMELEK